MDIIFPENLLQREILGLITPFLEAENIILLSGARQTGKTSLLYLLIRHLTNKRVPHSQVVYFDLENIHDFSQINNLKDFNDFWHILVDRGVNRKKRAFVFIDEIQHLVNPSSFLKYLHDHYKPKLKFVVTGSSSLEIRRKFTDRLTGRVYRFVVNPLSFREFLEFKDENDLAEMLRPLRFPLWISGTNPEKGLNKIGPAMRQRLDNLLNEYLIFGGYPAVTLQENPLIKQRDLQEIYSLYVRRDIKDLGGIADVTGYNRLVTLLCLQIGGLVKEQELAVSSGLSRPTVKKYLFLLENTYVFKLLLPFFTNKRTEIIKTPKVYFQDIGLRNGVLNNFTPLSKRTDSGAILENFVFTQLNKQDEQSDRIRFWRSQTKNEVDFVWQENVDEHYPIEVKLNYSPRQPLPSGLRTFIGTYRPARAFVIHLGGFHFQRFQDTNIYAIPAWAI